MTKQNGYVVMRVINFRVCYRQLDGSYSPEISDQTDIKAERERVFNVARAEKGLTVWIESNQQPKASPLPASKRPEVRKINAQLEKRMTNADRLQVGELLRSLRLQMSADSEVSPLGAS